MEFSDWEFSPPVSFKFAAFSISSRAHSQLNLTFATTSRAFLQNLQKVSIFSVSWSACCFSEWAELDYWEASKHSLVILLKLWILSESPKEVLSHINTVLNCSVFICYQIYAFGMLQNDCLRDKYISRCSRYVSQKGTFAPTIWNFQLNSALLSPSSMTRTPMSSQTLS